VTPVAAGSERRGIKAIHFREREKVRQSNDLQNSDRPAEVNQFTGMSAVGSVDFEAAHDKRAYLHTPTTQKAALEDFGFEEVLICEEEGLNVTDQRPPATSTNKQFGPSTQQLARENRYKDFRLSELKATSTKAVLKSDKKTSERKRLVEQEMLSLQADLRKAADASDAKKRERLLQEHWRRIRPLHVCMPRESKSRPKSFTTRLRRRCSRGGPEIPSRLEDFGFGGNRGCHSGLQ